VLKVGTSKKNKV